MRLVKVTPFLLVACVLAVAGCGEDDEPRAPDRPPADAPAAQKEQQRAADKGVRITLGESEFGSMLFDSRRQAIYIFERDTERRSVCYGACAEAWPPVLTKGRPKAGSGVRQALLGTVTRKGGGQQVTYDGKPLYFYAHEEAGEVRCHNVNLNGGLWWVVGPDGRRRA
jgi:predicted lipoprotein with Yx(FWY)xxD motif